MPSEPKDKRTISFIDGQNIFHTAKKVFGCTYPDYDPSALAHAICQLQGWRLVATRFYTGVPDPARDPFWSAFWSNKLAEMGRQGVWTYSGKIRFGKEKGVDIRIALDVVKLARRQQYDVALVFSQDQDLAEAAKEIREIARAQNRWIKIASAFPWDPSPVDPAFNNEKGIFSTDWIRIDRATYDSCRDPRDYRPKRKP